MDKQRNNIKFDIRVSQELLDQVKEYVRNNDTNVSAYVRELIIKDLNK